MTKPADPKPQKNQLHIRYEADVSFLLDRIAETFEQPLATCASALLKIQVYEVAGSDEFKEMRAAWLDRKANDASSNQILLEMRDHSPPSRSAIKAAKERLERKRRGGK